MDVFGTDAQVVEVDLELSFGEVFDLDVFDLDVFVLFFIVDVVVRRDDGIVC